MPNAKPPYPLRRNRRGNDGLTDAEREESAARWREGQGKPLTAEEVAEARLTRAECLAAAAAVEGAIHLVDDEESAQILARLADQWRDEAALSGGSEPNQPDATGSNAPTPESAS